MSVPKTLSDALYRNSLVVQDIRFYLYFFTFINVFIVNTIGSDPHSTPTGGGNGPNH